MIAAARRAPVRHVEHVMGTAVTFDVRGSGVEPAVLDAAIAHLHEVDARFSPYRTDSEVSRLARGEIAEAACSPALRDVLRACDALAAETGGAFDARRHRPDGRLDPSGYVKGWAVEGAARILRGGGATAFAVNAGGDVLAAGEPEAGRAWRVGIRHPDLAGRVAAVLEVRSLAVATSGLYERGAHVRDPRTGRAPAALRSATVVGPSLALADAYATAALVMGDAALSWIDAHESYGALLLTADDRVRWTPLLDGLLA